jgi:type I restriction enzyme R subunit
MLDQVQSLNKELVAVRLQLQHVEKYSKPEAYVCLSEQDKNELVKNIAPLVYMEDKDEYAKRFDNFMYGMILIQMEGLPGFNKTKQQLCGLMGRLEKKSTIPQVKDKLPLIRSVSTDEFWNSCGILSFENIRKELRELIKFTIEDVMKPIFTDLKDPIIDRKEGEKLDAAYDFQDYRLKVNRYVEEHKDHIAIWKLRNNIPMTSGDYEALSQILIKDLGSSEDYEREFGDTPFGLLIRRIVKLEHEAAMMVFSKFINDQSLNQHQIVFVKKIIDYVEQNGYIENVSELMKPPFDKPMSFVKIFDSKEQSEIIRLVKEIKENAVKVTA